jgi:ribosome-binding protein aMBF1 (putative translation factor)
MATNIPEHVSPIGDDVTEHRPRKMLENRKYREAVRKYAFAEQIARLLISHRMEHALTQKQLASVLKMTVPEVSRLESGEHTPSGKTTERILEALEKHIVFVDNVRIKHVNSSKAKGKSCFYL